MSNSLPDPQYIDVRINGRLLFKFDPGRDVVEIRNQGETVYVDLARLRRKTIMGMNVIFDERLEDGNFRLEYRDIDGND